MATIYDILKSKGIEPGLLYPSPVPSHGKAPKGKGKASRVK